MSADRINKHPSSTILLLASGGMDVIWLSAWVNFMMTSLAQRMFPLPAAIAAFSLAAILTSAMYGRGWRWIAIIGLHLAGCLLATLIILYAFRYQSDPFWSRMWLHALFSPPGTPLEGIILFFTIVWGQVFWVSGIRFARRSRAYRDVCARFDLGIGMLGGLLLLQLALAHDGVPIHDPMTRWLILPFILFGIVAIGSVRNRDQTRATYRTGYRLIGVVLSFAVVVSLAGVGLLTLCWPYFMLIAETGYDLLQQGVHPFLPVLVAILRFLFMPRGRALSEPATTTGNGAIDALPPGETHWWTALLAKFLSWGGGGVMLLLLALMFGVGIWRLVRWLLSKTQIGERKPYQAEPLLAWLLTFWIGLRLCWEWIFRCFQGYATAAQLYRMLNAWGRSSGLPRRPTETPGEYGARLSRHFPAIHQEIMLLVALFQQEAYGECVLSAQQVTLASQAVRQLRRPAYWPPRIRTWFKEESAA